MQGFPFIWMPALSAFQVKELHQQKWKRNFPFDVYGAWFEEMKDSLTSTNTSYHILLVDNFYFTRVQLFTSLFIAMFSEKPLLSGKLWFS